MAHRFKRGSKWPRSVISISFQAEQGREHRENSLLRMEMRGSSGFFDFAQNEYFRSIYVAPLALRSGLRQRGSVFSFRLPSVYPSSRVAELGNTLG
jgi:hypothetical protein